MSLALRYFTVGSIAVSSLHDDIKVLKPYNMLLSNPVRLLCNQDTQCRGSGD